MIDPPQVLSEEPTAVTPHGGICGGESQQWLTTDRTACTVRREGRRKPSLPYRSPAAADAND